MERKRGVAIFSLTAFQNVHDPFGRGTFPEKSPLQLFQNALKMYFVATSCLRAFQHAGYCRDEPGPDKLRAPTGCKKVFLQGERLVTRG